MQIKKIFASAVSIFKTFQIGDFTYFFQKNCQRPFNKGNWWNKKYFFSHEAQIFDQIEYELSLA
jgi:hypothetical protein